MGAFETRLHYFETNFALNQEACFRVKILRNKKFAQFIANLLGMRSDSEKDSYASAMVDSCYRDSGDKHLIEHALHDLKEGGVAIHERALEVELQNCEKKARSEVASYR